MGPGPVTAVALVAAYLLGSIPFSYLVARRKGIDVRTVGSGNVGATNVMRSAGRAAGLTAFALDFLKGSLATWLAPAHGRAHGARRRRRWSRWSGTPVPRVALASSGARAWRRGRARSCPSCPWPP